MLFRVKLVHAIWIRLIYILAIFNTLHGADLALTAMVSCPPVGPGGTAQITIMLPSPVAITHGGFQVDLDPSVFGNISAVNVFSASGDQQGVARITAQHAEAVFGAESGGIGRLPNLAVAQITAPVLATAATGTTGTVTVESSSAWFDVSGQRYDVVFQSPGVPIGDGMSVQSVTPGGGPVPGGTVVAINGQGFSNSTNLQLDGVAWSNLQFIGSSLLNITLTGPANLAGKLLVLTDKAGSSARYYSSLTPTTVNDEVGSPGIWPIFPVTTHVSGGSSGLNWWFENDSANPIDVTFSAFSDVCTPCAGNPFPPSKTITVPAGTWYFAYYNPYGGGWPILGALMTATAPIHVLQAAIPASGPLPELNPTALSAGGTFRIYGCIVNAIDYRLGDPAPQPITCDLYTPFTEISVGTDDGNPWMRISSVMGSPTKVQVTFYPDYLTIGSHIGVVRSVLPGSPPQSLYSVFPLNVHENATIAVSPPTSAFPIPFTGPVTFSVTSTSPSVPITVSSSASWLHVTPSSATTPATLSAEVDSSAPPAGEATITIQGPANVAAISIETYISGLFGNLSSTFVAKAGDTTLQTTMLSAAYPLHGTATTDSGGNWLSVMSAQPQGSDSDWTLSLQADPSGLPVGLYHGTVTVTEDFPGVPEVPVNVVLSIWGDPIPALAVSPASLMLTPENPSGTLTVSTGPMPLNYAVTFQSDPFVYLNGGYGPAITPQSFDVSGQSLYPGTYQGQVLVTAPPGTTNSVIVPVTITQPSVPLTDETSPKIGAIVNGASMLAGPLSPGEILTVFGLVQSVGNAGLSVGSDGKVNREHYGNRVLFNGVAAPLLYESIGQINAVVPYEVAGSQTVTVQIDDGVAQSDPQTLPVAPSAPGLFTQNQSGQGDAAILNQDSSLNTPQNPASPGSIVQIFLTGEGQTNPPGITGELTGLDTKNPTQTVKVQIGGANATIVSATTAPDAVAGLFQINAMVPAGSATGSVPLLVQIGTAMSQPAATINVK